MPNLNEIETKDLPPELVKVVKEVMLGKKASAVPLTKAHKGSGDYYSYKISIQDDDIHKIVECNELNIKDDLKLLVRYIERNSKKSK